MAYELDPSNPDTLINQPSPHVPKFIIEALTNLGGRQLDGTPNIRVVWGQTERRFACGDNRIKYPTSFSKEKADYVFRLRNIETGECTVCNYEEFMEAKKRYEEVDPTITHLAEFKVSRQVEWIGIPRFIIEQYKPVLLLKDTPLNWEKNRYGWWFNPVTRKNEWTDVTGPFPYEGRYEHFLTVKEDDGTHFGKYSPITEREIELVRQALQAREIHKAQSAEIEVKNLVEAKAALLEKREAELADEIADSLAPHVNKMYENKVKYYQ